MARALCDTGGLCIVFWCESAAVLGGLCGHSSNACTHAGVTFDALAFLGHVGAVAKQNSASAWRASMAPRQLLLELEEGSI
eukprot:scaffold5832_cov109-Isochrysis_galbana.AAC.5